MSILVRVDLIGSCFALSQFTDTNYYYFFYKLKVCDNPALSKSISTIFPTAIFSLYVSCHILVILTIFQIFPLLLYLLWESMISVCCYYYDLLKAQMMISIFSDIFKLRHIHCFLDIMHTNKLQYSVSLICTEKPKKFMWFTLLWYSLHWDSLEVIPQYLQGMPVVTF